MKYRETIEAALKRDEHQYGKVWRGEQKDTRTSHEIDVMLEEKLWTTTLGQKGRTTRKMKGFAKRNNLSSTIVTEIERRADRYIVVWPED